MPRPSINAHFDPGPHLPPDVVERSPSSSLVLTSIVEVPRDLGASSSHVDGAHGDSRISSPRDSSMEWRVSDGAEAEVVPSSSFSLCRDSSLPITPSVPQLTTCVEAPRGTPTAATPSFMFITPASAKGQTIMWDSVSNEISNLTHSEEVDSQHQNLNVNGLIGNDVSQALAHWEPAPGECPTWDFERWLVQLSEGHVGMGGVSRTETDSYISPTPGTEVDQVKQLFERLLLDLPEEMLASETICLQDQHFALGRVLRTIFAEHTLDSSHRRSSWVYNFAPLAIGIGQQLGARVHFGARRIVEHNYFVGFFMLLTLYALFGSDLVILCGDKEHDMPVLVINTVCLFLYMLEIVLHMCGQKGYLASIVFALDLIALFSIFTDSWFMQGGDFDEESSRASRLARSSRLTRLARIARIARVTRMIPALMALCMHQKVTLAKRILLRRLWRAFLFMDTDRDGVLSFFDLKFFYVSVLHRCPNLLKMRPVDILEVDIPSIHCRESGFTHLEFDGFCRVFLNTALGKELLRFHQDDLERDAGVWTLFRKVSDRTALKLCVGILMLLSILQLFSLDVKNVSAQQGLAQLDVIAKAEHSTGGGMDPAYLCEQIGFYARSHHIIVMVLDGWIHWQDGRCVENATSLLRHRIPAILAARFSLSGLRNQEVLQVCWPNAYECLVEGANSVALIDQSTQYRAASGNAVASTVTVILLLLLYMYILNMKISQFCKTMLQPLRALLDDMVVLTNLELTGVDEDPPETAKTQNEQQAAGELRDIQDSFKTMRNAIRSWSRYVPPAVVQGLFRAGLEATIGVSKCSATILFCDINGFEDVCEGLSPEQVLDLLSTVLGIIAGIIHRHGGTLLEFIGDEVLAVFNTPARIKDHASAGVLTAMQINSEMEQHTFATRSGTLIAIQCRSGVHTGQIFAGNIGSHQRMKYGLLGDGINLTARLKGLNTRYNIKTLVSESCMSQVKRIHFRPIDLVAVKGRSEPTFVYEPMVHAEAKNLCAKHTKAFKAYMARRFSEARAAFEEVNDALEKLCDVEDMPCRMLAERCAGYLLDAPPDTWDGVERLQNKAFAPKSAGTEAASPASALGERSMGEVEDVDQQPGSKAGSSTDFDAAAAVEIMRQVPERTHPISTV